MLNYKINILPLLSFRLKGEILENFSITGFLPIARIDSAFIRIFFILFFVVLLSKDITAQTQKQWLKHADKSYEEKDYYGASLYYRNAMLVDSSSLYVVYRYAECLRLFNEYKGAEKYYRYVYIRDKARTYNKSLFWLAMMQKYNAKYIDARKSFIQFVNIFKQKDSYYYKKAFQEIKSCEFALGLIKNPTLVHIYNLGDSLNTVDAEFSALQVNDSTLYVSSPRTGKVTEINAKSDKKYFTKIYEAERMDTLWRVKKELDSIINNSSNHNANGSLSKDGSRFYFSRCDDTMRCEIYVSEIKNGNWQEAKKLNDSINLPGYTSTQPCIALIDTTEVLFFTSNRPEGKGKLDIWYSFREGNDFSAPGNAGSIVNSMDDEVSPWYDSKNKTLYFSSSWHYGLGGQDIFKSVTDSNGFSTPENLGYPLNSSVNDFYYTYADTSRSGFFTSNRKGSMGKKGETCCNDIWHYEYYEIIQKDTTPVIPPDPLEELAKFIPTKLYFHNDEPNPRTKDTLTTLNYITTYEGYSSLINTYKENYSKGLKEEQKQAAEDSIQSFFEHHVDKGVNDLEQFTEALLKQLEKGYKLDLTVKGHASPLAKTSYNIQLTLRRISSLENYFREYKEGVFVPYLIDSAANGGHLRIIKIPFGEYKADEYTSDNLNDKKNSVFSIAAAIHRNIEIVSVTLEHKDSSSAQIRFRKEIHDFGAVVSGHKVTHTFKFKNSGKEPLVISSLTTSCPCITVQGPGAEIPPGEKGEIIVTFDTTGLKGKQLYNIILQTNAIPAEKDLSISAEVR